MIETRMDSRENEFKWTHFWIQVHELEVENFTTENAWIIANIMGQCKDVE